MECYAVIENCQEGIEPENGFAAILGLFLIDPADGGKSALVKAEECLCAAWEKAKAGKSGSGPFESGNPPERNDDGMLEAEWVCSGNDTAHFLDVRKQEIS